MPRMIFDPCLLVKCNMSPSKQGRLYITLVDIAAEGAKFEFSSDTLAFAEVSQHQGKMGVLEGKFSSYEFTDQKSGAPRTGWKGVDVTFKPAK